MADVRDSDELSRFFSLCQDMLCIAGTDGYFRRLNPAWTRIVGWSEEELCAAPYLDFVHPDDRDRTIREASAIAAGHVTVSFDNRYRCRDGSYKWLQWTSVLFTEDQQIYATARDITALKTAEMALREAHDEASRATQAKNEFLSRMSHDLRTPLNAIMGFAQMLQLDELTPDQTDSLAHILRGGRHLLQLINEVLDIARIEAGRLSLSLEPVALKDVVPEAVALIGPLAEQRQIAIELADLGELTVLADRQRLTQILLNLLANAVKYNRHQGRVTVSARLADPGVVSIAIADTGVGIPADKLALLFKPFERLGAEQSEVEGTGLGLALSKGLTEAMHGSIVAESVVDTGSIFRLELPNSDVAALRSRDTQGSGSAEPDTAGVVVYIEDNNSNLRLMERLLTRRPGVDLVHAPDGPRGLSLVRDRRPDLVLLDLHLPGMPGEEVLRQIWEDPATRKIPVAVLSADATPAQQRHLLAAGAIAYLTKPFDIGEVLRLVDRNLTRSGRETAGMPAASGVVS
jgi:PAS domain S-box-containing protein